jgi:tetratricopeptide (TPR) repeat protein
MNSSTIPRFAITIAIAALATPVAAQEHRHGNAHEHAVEHEHGRMPLLEGLGSWRHAITTRSVEAQAYFDQGLRLAYAFNHDEAARSFEEAARLDPSCAMCQWGIAYAVGPNINLPMEPAAELIAVRAMREAVRLAGGASPLERALIDAMAVRFAEPVGEQRAARDSAWAGAMRQVATAWPADADVQVLYADALLNLRPWDQWTRDGQPQPGTGQVVAALERAMAIAPEHAGACHFYVHAVEASPTPELALPCAEKLPHLMPGAGHIVHMPAHVYLRVGLYDEAARANIQAVEADRRYFADRDVPAGIYPMFYAPHNLHFLWAAYVLSGQRDNALGAARALIERVPVADALEAAALEGFLPSAILTFARFGEWDAVLREPEPHRDLRYTRGMWFHARGVAYAATGRLDEAAMALDSVRGIADGLTADVIIILNPAPALLGVAAEVLAARIAGEQGRHDDAVAHLREAVVREDALTYDEPPPWYHSTRNQLGESLLAAGRAAEAETVFRDDLRSLRENGWSLEGLERALQAQGRSAEANAAAARFVRAWQHADREAHRLR